VEEVVCPPGTGFNDSSACVPCDEGLYSAGGPLLSTVCLACGDGATSNANRTGCDCDVGYANWVNGTGCTGAPRRRARGPGGKGGCEAGRAGVVCGVLVVARNVNKLGNGLLFHLLPGVGSTRIVVMTRRWGDMDWGTHDALACSKVPSFNREAR
jgi:hypothetical protein